MYSQRHIDRQDIHAVGGVEGDLSNRLADDGCKVRIIGIEAQLGTMPDVGHMMQAVLTAIGGGQNYAVDLVGLVVQIKTGDFHLVGGMVTVGIQLTVVPSTVVSVAWTLPNSHLPLSRLYDAVM